jgi:hypothetical protein
MKRYNWFSKLLTFQTGGDLPFYTLDTAKQIWIGHIIPHMSKLTLYLISYQRFKNTKKSLLFLERLGPTFHPYSTFSPLDNTKKKLYVNVPDMLTFNLKTSVFKYLIFSGWYNFFRANVSDFYTYFTYKS